MSHLTIRDIWVPMLNVMSRPFRGCARGIQLGLEFHFMRMDSFQENWFLERRDDCCYSPVVLHMKAELAVYHMEPYHELERRHARPPVPLSRLHRWFMPPPDRL